LIELGLAKDYEHVVCNRDVDTTAREILAMIAAEHDRRRTRGKSRDPENNTRGKSRDPENNKV
jgi:hypothetical protein